MTILMNIVNFCLENISREKKQKMYKLGITPIKKHLNIKN